MTHGDNSTEHCIMWPDKPERCNVVLNVQRAFSSLSIVGCLFVGFIIIIFKKYKAIVHKLIFWLTVSALVNSLVLLIDNIYRENGHFCRFQGFVNQYFSWALLLWVLMISVNCLVIVKGKRESRYYYVYHLVVWFGSLFWSIIPLFGHWYGPAGIWCWVKRGQVALRFGIWYAPLLITCIAMLGIYGYIIRNVLKFVKQSRIVGRSQEDERTNKRLREEVKPLFVYPLIYLVFSIPVFMYRLEDASNPNHPPSYALAILSVIFIPSLGMCYAFAFAIFSASVNDLSVSKLKEGFREMFSPAPTRVVHDYQVEDDEESNSRTDSISSYQDGNYGRCS